MEQKDGGPAFPTSHIPGYPTEISGGITMRDYFAAKAMQGIILGNAADECALGLGAAKDAYAVADAMLIARAL